MRLFGIFLALLIAFGTIMPHAAPAHQQPAATPHHMGAHDMGKSHDNMPRDCTGCATGCIGCAAPVQRTTHLEAPETLPSLALAHFQPTALAAFVTPLELPPPRLKA